jgi:hypothetical protein
MLEQPNSMNNDALTKCLQKLPLYTKAAAALPYCCNASYYSRSFGSF